MKITRKIIAEYIFIIICAVLTTFNYLFFIVNNRFAPAGISGILTIIQYKTGISLGLMTLIVNIPLCAIAFFVIEREFAAKSLVFCLADGISYMLFQKVDLSSFAYNANGVDTVLPVLIAGTVSGVIYGCLFKINGSTGGVDIIAKMIDKKIPYFSFIWIIFILNAIVAAISYFVYYDVTDTGKIIYNFKPVALCILYNFMSSKVSNSMLNGSKSAVKIEIITTRPKEITEAIINKIERGVTMIKAVGAYSNSDKTILVCVVSRHQMIECQNIIHEYGDTFAYISSVSEVFGNFSQKSF
ncbi:MAG: YitT family protein [Eubacteriales bacterium]|nr:YitT family protein [Eubacteriales bacterium]